VFNVEPLEEMLSPKVVYGLITVDNRNAAISLFEGDKLPAPRKMLTSDFEGKGNPHFAVKKKMKSYYHGKTKKGGSRSAKISRSISGQSKHFMDRVAEATKEILMPNGRITSNLKGVVIGGSGTTKNDFVQGDYLHPYLRNMIVSVEDVEFCDESGLRQLIIKAADKIEEAQVIREMKQMEDFLEGVATDGSVAYGKDEIEKALKAGAVKTLLLSEKLDSSEIESYMEKAEENGAEVEIFSATSEYGHELWESFKGIGALLKKKQ
jgi:peptide chain release factor subunit 1